MDAVVVASQISPYIVAAVQSFGAAVLTRVNDAGAEASVSLGQRIIQRILRRDAADRSEEETAVATAVDDLVGAPDDSDLQAALRVQIKKALVADPELATAVGELAQRGGISIIASGERAVAAHTIHGNIHTGDTTPGTPR
ncbi:hypothetical protein ACFWFF_28300 [Streptomyces sp. NPDC060223]|uniref:hypothetical protein n=1 Tax=unclassified Streptomyces TaxID=2593676 RepID=UPI003639D684